MDTITDRRACRLFAALALVTVLASSCATPRPHADMAESVDVDSAGDPAEPLNRAVFEFNRGVDTMVLKPAATAYKTFLPPPIQTGIRNFLNNLRSPIIALHDLLQGEMERAGDTLARFAINSTVGILGFRDQATEWGYEFHNEDFGQTLAAWGVGEGPYVVLPVLGPSNPRDTVGMVVDFLVDPVNLLASNAGYDEAVLARTGTQSVDTRAGLVDGLAQLEKASVDYYATIRSVYRQRRAHEISNGETDDSSFGPSLDLTGKTNGEVQTAALPVLKAVVPPHRAIIPAVVPPVREEILVRMASYATHEDALRGWEAMLDRQGAIFENAEPVFTEVVEGRRTVIELSAALSVEGAVLMASLPEDAAAPYLAAEPAFRPVAAEPAFRPVAAEPREIARPSSRPRVPATVRAPHETRVHLASYRNHEDADRGWEAFVIRHEDALADAEPILTEVATGSETYVRLLAALPAFSDADSLCNQLSAESAYCRISPD